MSDEREASGTPAERARDARLALALAIERYEPLWSDGVRRTTYERFVRFFAHHESLCRAAIAAGIAAHAVTTTGEALPGSLRLEDTEHLRYVLDALWGGLGDGLSYIGYDEGYFYGGVPWEDLCVLRSALEVLTELSGVCDPEMGADGRDAMDTFAYEMFVAVEVPEGIPASHWWWRAPHPPAK